VSFLGLAFRFALLRLNLTLFLSLLLLALLHGELARTLILGTLSLLCFLTLFLNRLLPLVGLHVYCALMSLNLTVCSLLFALLNVKDTPQVICAPSSALSVHSVSMASMVSGAKLRMAGSIC